ncbi:hypothetical protein SODALDRAFT_271668 [Sodiomyces alkalinus F11]|uniref:Zn(2)-C6 fungal-type domain-containing protein n=1 Tax=Sodiomyces alkalinus (strain CBS 110278 / VKM F-3762 / F11) TaxID=1314773 RepID=A0A3N2Q1S5_SODAK|nr:hypothetical protein SODALDRAFT_271668 [Sodiomyces alkalinus F11]ROT40709.1 hypothetical protein SODALDRAFT_271668 [Sodiomyces alkalinus F11]
MGDYYHHFLASMSGAGQNPSKIPPEAYPSPFSVVQSSSSSIAGPATSSSYQAPGFLAGIHEPLIFNPSKSHKVRRKSAPGIDHVKHRRTRSGCFMCRSRRVKCDETRPICERCRKGNRECIYPDPPPSKSASSQSSSLKETAGTGGTVPMQRPSPSSSLEVDDLEEDTGPDVALETIPDQEEGGSHDDTLPSKGPVSMRPSSPATSVGTSVGHSTSTPPAPDLPNFQPSSRADWSHLPASMQRYMDYYYHNITHHHYCIVFDGDDFFRNMLPQLALGSESLLNALVGFSAYLYTLEHNPDGDIHEFLQYYNKSVIMLIEFLKRKEKPSIHTLFTILQLATIEEYLGDWINLMGHQKAAHELLITLFTPKSAMETVLGRMAVSWYARFDVFIAIMGGFPTSLSHEWFTEYVDYCQTQILLNGDNPQLRLNWKIDKESALVRLLSREMSMLYARGSRGQISPEAFQAEHSRILQRLLDWRAEWDRELVDPAFLVTDFGHGAPPRDESDIVDPYTPGILYREPLFPTTKLIVGWMSMVIMHLCQSPTTDREKSYADLRDYSYNVCACVELIDRWPGSPKGSLIAAQATTSMSALFLPKDKKHSNWFRRKFALIESKGYIHPANVRVKMGEMFREPSCARWWLPNDEGYSPILKAVRSLADERNAAAINAQQENLREVRHIFAKLDMSDTGDG